MKVSAIKGVFFSYWSVIALQCSVSFCCTIKAVFLKAPTRLISSDLALGHLKRARQACSLAHLYIFKLLPKIPLICSLFLD